VTGRWLLDGAEIARLDAREPVAVVDERRVRRNVAAMAARAAATGARLRPHVKTHQTVEIASWCREAGARGITVSSLAMARAYVGAGWDDVTIALPANPRWAPELSRLAERARVGVLLDDPAAARALDAGLTADVAAWLKIDVGYGRAGVRWDDRSRLAVLAAAVAGAAHLSAAGVLTHAGQSYAARGRERIAAVCGEALERLTAARRFVADRWGGRCAASFGDTPCCSVLERFLEVDELRPGNYVFHDLMQHAAGVCDDGAIALAVACPVLSVQRERGRLLLHGGAVHLSKERLPDGTFGRLLAATGAGFGSLHPTARLAGLSQEHGLLEAPADLLETARPGDVVLVAPVHSCLAADLADRIVTWEGTALTSLRRR